MVINTKKYPVFTGLAKMCLGVPVTSACTDWKSVYSCTVGICATKRSHLLPTEKFEHMIFLKIVMNFDL